MLPENHRKLIKAVPIMELPKYRYINNLSAITCPIVKFFVTRNVTRISLFLSVFACEMK